MQKRDGRSKSNVRDAAKQSSVPMQLSEALTAGKYNQHAPYYADPERQKLARFLAVCLIDAQYALERTRLLIKGLESDPRYGNKALYWEHVVSAISWLGTRIRQRQRHLVEVPEDVIAEIASQWLDPSQT